MRATCGEVKGKEVESSDNYYHSVASSGQPWRIIPRPSDTPGTPLRAPFHPRLRRGSVPADYPAATRTCPSYPQTARHSLHTNRPRNAAPPWLAAVRTDGSARRPLRPDRNAPTAPAASRWRTGRPARARRAAVARQAAPFPTEQAPPAGPPRSSRYLPRQRWSADRAMPGDRARSSATAGPAGARTAQRCVASSVSDLFSSNMPAASSACSCASGSGWPEASAAASSTTTRGCRARTPDQGGACSCFHSASGCPNPEGSMNSRSGRARRNKRPSPTGTARH